MQCFQEVSCNNKNTISLCPYIELRQQKEKEGGRKKKQKNKPALSSSQRGTNIQYKSILFQKKGTNKNATKYSY